MSNNQISNCFAAPWHDLLNRLQYRGIELRPLISEIMFDTLLV
uniref:Uncharacterized protein n=1 Tax=Arundo donax TaxID=35708 RepID=A0A0A8Y350_ARUDO